MLDARIRDGLSDIRSSWTLDDLVHAHELLDELDVVEARARSEAETQARMKGQVRAR